jgi:uncharacterized protein
MSVDLSPNEISRKYDQLLAVVAANPGWVAFSGGIDSTLLLRAAVEVCPSQTVALFADSPLQSQVDRENIGYLVDRLGVRFMVVEITPLLWPEFVVNPPDRCYLCKKSVYRKFQTLLPHGASLLDGTNLDDLAAGRPGQRAINELGVVSPLALAGLSKVEVREVGRWLRLPNWSRPSASCLATRIPEGIAITPELLRHIEACERAVRFKGFGHIRVRLNDGRFDDVTVELASEELGDGDFSARRTGIEAELARLGIVRLRFVGRDGVFPRNISRLSMVSRGEGGDRNQA